MSTEKRPPITIERRQEIFAKDYLTVVDMQDILGLDYNTAAKIIREIKNKIKIRGGEPRIDAQGKVHVQDYLDVYKLPPERYLTIFAMQEVGGNANAQ